MPGTPLTREQIEDKIAIWQQRLDLLHWRIELVVGTPPTDKAEVIAEVDAQDQYYDVAVFRLHQKAIDEWPSDRWGDDFGRPPDVVIAHELLHCAMRTTDRAAMHLREGQTHRDVESVLDSAYHEARENFVDHLAVALYNGWGLA